MSDDIFAGQLQPGESVSALVAVKRVINQGSLAVTSTGRILLAEKSFSGTEYQAWSPAEIEGVELKRSVLGSRLLLKVQSAPLPLEFEGKEADLAQISSAWTAQLAAGAPPPAVTAPATAAEPPPAVATPPTAAAGPVIAEGASPPPAGAAPRELTDEQRARIAAAARAAFEQDVAGDSARQVEGGHALADGGEELDEYANDPVAKELAGGSTELRNHVGGMGCLGGLVGLGAAAAAWYYVGWVLGVVILIIGAPIFFMTGVSAAERTHFNRVLFPRLVRVAERQEMTPAEVMKLAKRVVDYQDYLKLLKEQLTKERPS